MLTVNKVKYGQRGGGRGIERLALLIKDKWRICDVERLSLLPIKDCDQEALVFVFFHWIIIIIPKYLWEITVCDTGLMKLKKKNRLLMGILMPTEIYFDTYFFLIFQNKKKKKCFLLVDKLNNSIYFDD